jgi:hypothetical protein
MMSFAVCGIGTTPRALVAYSTPVSSYERAQTLGEEHVPTVVDRRSITVTPGLRTAARKAGRRSEALSTRRPSQSAHLPPLYQPIGPIVPDERDEVGPRPDRGLELLKE